MGRIIAMTDIHGCLTEFKILLEKIQPTNKDKLIVMGDLVDRGPDSNGVCELISDSNLNFECLIGNHDHRYIRYLKYEEQIKNGLINKNPMNLNNSYKEIYDSLSEKSKSFLLKKMKPFIQETINGKQWIFVHAGIPNGFKPDKPIDDKTLNAIIHYRYLDKDTGRFISLSKDKSQPENSIFWTENYYGEFNVIYGHNVFESIKFDINERGSYCIGIDTGCVFGGALTAFEPATHKSWAVKAEKKYWINKQTLRD